MKRRINADSSIPTSSMADIAFLLIIFFMVTSVFSATRGLGLQLPDDDTGQADPEPAVLIHVLPDRVVVDCEEMAMERILPYLETRLLRNPGKPVILYTDSRAQYQEMIAVYDLLAEIEIENLSVPTRGEIDDYVRLFGTNPLDAACGQ